ncbi:hypothetical protein [Pedobacter boryungensis]|uniref:Uncharacterized protein n=1 Tax=Pedobacter boryungensis TaxID=869962 RepID=A0ABX2DCT2_9SPHI|nr:hypothetical protein [Pedobacter boryungensis]NQX31889.1 hypothetical protein [Pedobacter boryungensis]
MKKIFLSWLFIFLVHHAFSQGNVKKLYFLADTTIINTAKSSDKILEIKWTSPFHYSFIFKSSYKAPYYNYLEFSCWVDKKNPKPKIESKKPCFKYISLKELLNLVNGHFRYFNDEYDLYIIEVLSENRYQTIKVELMPQTAPTTDGVIIKQK